VTISQLRESGYKNFMQTKVIDYSQFANPDLHGISQKRRTFHSFEDQINEAFQLEKTLPADRNSKRVGLLGYKIGMTHFWNRWGQIVPCTVIQIDRCQVTQVKTKEKDGVDSIQIGCGEQRLKNLNKPQAGHFLKYNLPPKRHLAEFPVTPENFLPVGYCLGPRHFSIG
jgi:large subunit ribosomal protein L3